MEIVATDLRLGEAMQVSPHAYYRIAGTWRRILLPAWLGLAIGLLIAPTLAAILLMLFVLPAPPAVAAWLTEYSETLAVGLEIVAGILGWRVGEQYGARRHFNRFLAGLRERGTPETHPTRFRLEPDGLHVEADRGSGVATWPSIVEVFALPGHWLLQADGMTFAIPRRAFESPDQEREFVERLSGFLTDDARRRSAEALAPPAPA